MTLRAQMFLGPGSERSHHLKGVKLLQTLTQQERETVMDVMEEEKFKARLLARSTFNNSLVKRTPGSRRTQLPSTPELADAPACCIDTPPFPTHSCH